MLNRTVLEKPVAEVVSNVGKKSKVIPLASVPLHILGLLVKSTASNEAIESASIYAKVEKPLADDICLTLKFKDGTYVKANGKELKDLAEYIFINVKPAKDNLRSIAESAPELDTNHKQTRESEEQKEIDYNSVFAIE